MKKKGWKMIQKELTCVLNETEWMGPPILSTNKQNQEHMNVWDFQEWKTECAEAVCAWSESQKIHQQTRNATVTYFQNRLPLLENLLRQDKDKTNRKAKPSLENVLEEMNEVCVVTNYHATGLYSTPLPREGNVNKRMLCTRASGSGILVPVCRSGQPTTPQQTFPSHRQQPSL